ncbi:MAG: glycosyltransferase family 87 protein [Alphaproteobacteria bacterium]
MALAWYMAARDSPPALPLLDSRGHLERLAFAVSFAYLAFLAAMGAAGFWLVDVAGEVVATDFVNVWSAGKLVLAGTPEAAYDWTSHKSVEAAALGHSFAGYFGWHYPPAFLFVAAGLALLPYLAAFFVWMAATLPAYLIVVQRILPFRDAVFLAVAFPATLLNVWVGQNGFLTAALVGGALFLLPGRPLAAGILFGLLSYKPQFGILVPIVLIAAGAWKAFGSAALTAVFLAGLSWAAFGGDTWQAFFASLPHTNEAVLAGGMAGWNELQSLFGVLRWIGAGYVPAFALQLAFATALAVVLCIVWRRQIAYEMKAAALASAVLLATPYVYIYDLTVLMVAAAFFVRAAHSSGWNAGEVPVLIGAAALILLFPFVSAPLGVVSACAVFALAVRRTLSQARDVAPAPAQS